MKASPLRLDVVDVNALLWQVFGRSESCAEYVFAHRPLTDLALSKSVMRRLHRIGITTIGHLLSRNLDNLQRLAQSHDTMPVEIMEQLGAFLGVEIEPSAGDFGSEASTIFVTPQIVEAASLDTIHELPWNVPLAELCCIDIAALPSGDLNTSIDDMRLNLKTRSRNGLGTNDVQTVADLLQDAITIQQLVGFHNMGVGSAWDVLIHLYHFCHRDRVLDLTQARAGQESFRTHHNSPRGFCSNIIERALNGELSHPALALDELDEEVPLRHLLDTAHLPANILSVPVTSPRLDFSNRPLNCLRRAHCDSVDDVLNLSLRELFALRNMGAGSVWEIVSTLFRLCRSVDATSLVDESETDTPPQEDVPTYIRRIILERPDQKWTFDELAARLVADHHLGLRAANATVRSLPQLSTLGERVVWLEGDNPYEFISSGQVVNFRALLDEVLVSAASERNIGVLSKYFGFDGTNQTLQGLADSSGSWNGNAVSRERVRQIIEQTQKRLRKDETVRSLLTFPLRDVMANVGGIVRMSTIVGEIERRCGDTRGELSIDGYLRFAIDLEEGIYKKFTAAKINFASRRFVLAQSVGQESLQRLIERVKQHLDTAQGPIADELLGALIVEWWPQIIPEAAPPRLHRTECLHLDFDLELNDDCWHWRSNMRGHRLTVVDHIVAIMRENREPMHFSQIAAAFRERVREIKNNGIHGRLSAQPELFALVGPGTFGLVELGHTKVRWVRDIMADFLRQRGTPATVAEIQEAVWAERDAEAASIFMIMTIPENNRGLFKRFPGDRWGLAEWIFDDTMLENKDEKAKSLLAKLSSATTDTRQQKSQSEALSRLLARARTQE